MPLRRASALMHLRLPLLAIFLSTTAPFGLVLQGCSSSEASALAPDGGLGDGGGDAEGLEASLGEGQTDGGDGGARQRTVSTVSLIGERRIAHNETFQGTTVGGLSGIDFDPTSQTWFFIADDRSDLQPSRVYTAKLAFDATAFSAVDLVSTVSMKQPDGSTYPPKSTGDGKVADPEAVRFDPRTGHLFWTSEGERDTSPMLLIDPFVREIALDGSHAGELPLPSRYKMSATESGPRRNGVFEGLSLSADLSSFWVSLEEPLYEDGPRATPTEGAVIRIFRLSRSGQVEAEFAYRLEKIAVAPTPADAFAVNGVTDVLALSATKLLVLERSFSTGAGNTVRIYEADISAATNVRDVPALSGASFTPATKRLVVDFATLGLPVVDNLEGMAFGPTLANGHDSLVVVSDNNFTATQVTQLLAFDVTP